MESWKSKYCKIANDLQANVFVIALFDNSKIKNKRQKKKKQGFFLVFKKGKKALERKGNKK